MPNDENFVKFVGLPIQESFERYFELSREDALKNGNIFREIYKDYLYEAKLYNGIKRLKSKNLNSYSHKQTSRKCDKYYRKFEILDFCDFATGSDLEGKLIKADIYKESS
ncbi:TPA: hypothetical protein RZJ77_001286 [Campylobacter coli]|nr:hypothetical protein [Campylobacter coli]